MDISIALAIVVALVHILGYALYIKGIIRGTIAPETTSWTLWVLEGMVNVPTYLDGSEGHWAKQVLPIIDLSGAIATWMVAYTRDRFSPMKRWDWMVAGCAIAALVVWRFYGKALDANLILQIGTFISFIPITVGAWVRSEVEKPAPWMWWSLAYGLDIVIVGMNLHNWEELAYPVVCLFTHFLVGIIAFRHQHVYNNSLAKS